MKKKLMRMLLAVIMLATLLPVMAWAKDPAEVQINADNFPDEVFRDYVKDFDTDGNGALSEAEIAEVTGIYVSNMGISSLQGIAFFPKLEVLDCNTNDLTELDLSKNTELTYLECGINQLTKLDVSRNTALTELYCNLNKLNDLDVSHNSALEKLDCSVNPLYDHLDVSQNTALTELNCNQNKLTKLDVSKNTKLTGLSFASNFISDVDLSRNTELTELICAENELTNLDLSNNTKLTCLNCAQNLADSQVRLTALDVSKCPELSELRCAYHTIPSLDLSNNTKLTVLDCVHNELTALDVSKCPELTELYCSENTLTTLDLNHNPNLLALECAADNLSELDVSKCAQLDWLTCSLNDLTELDVSKNTELNYLDCSHNHLTGLDLCNQSRLKSLFCTNNDLTELNIRATQSCLLDDEDPDNMHYGFFGNQSDGSLTVFMTAAQKAFFDANFSETERNNGVLALDKPMITTQPSNFQGAEGDTAGFTVEAIGVGLVYQWQYYSPETDTWKDCSETGSNTNTLSVPITQACDGQQYRCKVTDNIGEVQYSNAATLTVISTPKTGIDRPIDLRTVLVLIFSAAIAIAALRHKKTED